MLYQKINGFFLRSWYNGPGPLCLRTNHVRSPWAWRNWLSVGTTSSRFAAPPILPPPLGIMKVGRNARAFLGNAADKRRMRTAWGSVHGIIRPGQKISKDFHFIRSAPHPFRNPPSYSRRRRKTSHNIPCTIPYENKLAKQVPPYHSKTEPNRAGSRTLPCPCRGTIEKADGHRRNSSVAVLAPGRKSW